MVNKYLLALYYYMLKTPPGVCYDWLKPAWFKKPKKIGRLYREWLIEMLEQEANGHN